MSKKRVLVIAHEMKPYIDQTDISTITSGLPLKYQNAGFEVRVLMPRFGIINERRHRLHEVVRLSGINVVVNDEDYPLVIKVASLPGARLQVYFLDNDDYFHRKQLFRDKEGNLFEDNVERMLFFCLGALETVKKFGWAPDFIHCHGWMSSLVPALLKSTFKDEPIFNHSQVIYTAYQEETFEGPVASDFSEKIKDNTGMDDALIQPFGSGDEVGLNVGGMHYADAVTLGSDMLPEEVEEEFNQINVPKIEYSGTELILDEYASFIKSLEEALA